MMPTIYFNTRDELTKIDLSRIVYISANGNYSVFHFLNGMEIMIGVNLKHVGLTVSRTAENQFIRIGRGVIVKRSCVTQINILKQELVLTDAISEKVFTISASREALKKLKDLMSAKN